MSVDSDPTLILCEVVSWDRLEALSILDDRGLVGGGADVLFIDYSVSISWINLVPSMLMHLVHFMIMTSVIHLGDIISTLEKLDDVVGRIDTRKIGKGERVASVELENCSKKKGELCQKKLPIL